MAFPFVAADSNAMAAPRDMNHGSVTGTVQAGSGGLNLAETMPGNSGVPSGDRASSSDSDAEDSAQKSLQDSLQNSLQNSFEKSWDEAGHDSKANVSGANINGASDRGALRPGGVDDRNRFNSSQLPDVGCLSRTICAVKDKIRWGSPAWTAVQCNNVATAVLSAAKRYALSPSLLLGVMINESDLNEKAARVTMRENKVYAKDSGLMAVRCVLDRHNRCLNGNVRGMAWTDLMKPETNIAVGARELAYWRSGGAVTKTVVKLRDAGGKLRPVFKNVPCRHKDHAYWAHYNHGPYYIAKGNPRHYPHRVAVIDFALASVLNVDAPELQGNRITIHDPGKRQRTVDRPLEARYRKLCTQIQSVGACSAVALN